MSDPTKATVTIVKDGPVVIEHAAALVLPDGTPTEAAPKLALCRCGRSANKPFCDGSHSGWSESA